MSFIKRIISIIIMMAMTLAATAQAKKPEVIKEDLTQLISPTEPVSGPLTEEDTEALARLYLTFFKNTLSENKSSSLISPLSIITALGMVADGASENTLSQFEKLFGLTTEQLDSAMAYYYLLLEKNADKVKFNAANSIWVSTSPTLHVNNDYISRVLGVYDPQFYAVDFAKPKTLESINSWVNEHTDGMIDKILDDLSPDTVMALINALVFDAKWATPYDSDYQVVEGKFKEYGGKTADVEMLCGEESSYITLNGAVGFSKAYEGGKFKFVALLPDEKTDVFDFIESLDSGELLTAMKKTTSAKVVTKMPKFSYDYKLEMSETLQSLGLTDAFDPYFADFSDLAKDDTGNIYISEVIHKTHIDVDNEGTKAAAVTAVIMVKATSAGPDDTKPIYITLDRPFVYMIVDSECNLPVFMGVVTEMG